MANLVPKPVRDLYEWISGAGDIRKAGAQQQAGINAATGTIRDAGKNAMELLAPYLQGGKQDYGTLREMVNSGYFNQAFPGSYQPPAPPQAQEYKPTWNQATQSFSSNRTPWQAPTMGPIQNMSLPQFRPSPPPQSNMQMQPGPQPQGGIPPQLQPKTAQDVFNMIIRQNPNPQMGMLEGMPQALQAILAPKTNLPGMEMGAKPWTGMNPLDVYNYNQGRGGVGPGIGSGPISTYGGYR